MRAVLKISIRSCAWWVSWGYNCTRYL